MVQAAIKWRNATNGAQQPRDAGIAPDRDLRLTEGATSYESGDVADATAPELSDAAVTLQRLVAGVTVRRTANGGLLIEAPPDTASTLGALFSGMAQLLQAAAASQARERGPVGRR